MFKANCLIFFAVHIEKVFDVEHSTIDRREFLGALNGYMTELMRREERNGYKVIGTIKERIELMQYLRKYAHTILDSSSEDGDDDEGEDDGSERGKKDRTTRKRRRGQPKYPAKAGQKGQMHRVEQIIRNNCLDKPGKKSLLNGNRVTITCLSDGCD